MIGKEIRYESCPAVPVEFHPYAELFPLYSHQEQDDLFKDIVENGVIEPIVMFEGKLLDGRNRYLAARRGQIEYPVVEFEGSDAQALSFVVSKNIVRRHLTESQRAMIAAKIAQMPVGRPSEETPQIGETSDGQEIGQICPIKSTEAAAKEMNVSPRSVKSAKQIRDRGHSDLVEAVERGAATVGAAAHVAKLPEEDQVEAVRSGTVRQVAARVRSGAYRPSETATREADRAYRAMQKIIAAMREIGGPLNAAETLDARLPGKLSMDDVIYAEDWLNRFADAYSGEPLLKGDDYDFFLLKAKEALGRVSDEREKGCLLGVLRTASNGNWLSVAQYEYAKEIIGEAALDPLAGL